jgi:hypothetical protein
MNKRGVIFRQIVMIFYLVMALIVVVTLIQRAKYVVNDNEYVDAYSKILALTINSMFYSDYDVEVSLNIPSLFKVDILGDKVKVNIGEIEDEHNFIPDNKFKIEIEREDNNLTLKKVEK